MLTPQLELSCVFWGNRLGSRDILIDFCHLVAHGDVLLALGRNANVLHVLAVPR